jgi:hypothetical protein
MAVPHRGAAAALCVWLLLAAAAHAAKLTLPHLPGDTFGGDSSCAPFLYNAVPFSGDIGSSLGATTQLIYDASHFTAGGASGNISIRKLAFRPGTSASQFSTYFPSGSM